MTNEAAQLQVTMRPPLFSAAEFNLEADTWTTDADAFIADNAETDDDLAAMVRALAVGDRFVFGGGAAPEFEIARIG